MVAPAGRPRQPTAEIPGSEDRGDLPLAYDLSGSPKERLVVVIEFVQIIKPTMFSLIRLTPQARFEKRGHPSCRAISFTSIKPLST